MTDLPASDSPAPRSSRGQRFWGGLLVLDSFFVIVFGGALAAKLYQHWTPPPQAAPRRTPKPKPAPAPAEAKAPEAKPAEAPKPAPPKEAPPPKPALLAEPPKREAPPLKAPEPAKAAPKPAPPPKAEVPKAKVRARAVDFRIKAPGARKVELAGAFFVREGSRAMVDQGGGLWTLEVYLMPDSYRYHFLVDGRKTLDPANKRVERGSSVMDVE